MRCIRRKKMTEGIVKTAAALNTVSRGVVNSPIKEASPVEATRLDASCTNVVANRYSFQQNSCYSLAHARVIEVELRSRSRPLRAEVPH